MKKKSFNYFGYSISKVRVKKSDFAPKGFEWRAEKKGVRDTQPTKEALIFALKLRKRFPK